jgi:hypothetical protein
MLFWCNNFLLWKKKLSETGVQQGDPLGPLLFCLTLHPVIKSLKSEFNVWYLDDGVLADDPSIVFNDFQEIFQLSSIVIYLTSLCVILAFFGMSGPV